MPYWSVDTLIIIPTLPQTNKIKISGDGILVIDRFLKSFPGGTNVQLGVVLARRICGRYTFKAWMAPKPQESMLGTVELQL